MTLLCLTVKVFTILVIVAKVNGVAPSWCYEAATCGPQSAQWPDSCRTGQALSPINISTSSLVKAQLLAPLQFSREFYQINDFDIFNNGRGVEIAPHVAPGTNATQSTIRVTGDGWNGTLYFVKLYFRWPTGHLINGKGHALESTFVFKRVGEVDYGMFGALYAINTSSNKALAPVISMLPKVTLANGVPQKITNGLNLSSLLPPVWDIYRYRGSLTIPPCSEGVPWSVFTQKLPITKAQMAAFSSLQDEFGKAIPRCIRTVQKTITKVRKHIYWTKVDKFKMRKIAF